jgi:Ca2+/H+ antiporter, TMEM165/GDT1 family
MIEAFGVTYLAVLAAEVVGDKFLYTTGILATRYRPTPMMAGIALAFTVKMGAAVIIGDTIAGLPRSLVAAMTAVGVVWVCFRFWRSSVGVQRQSGSSHGSEAVIVSFGSVLFSEWADFGQLTAAAMAARFGSPVPVWCGAVGAMLTKAFLAAIVGAKVRERFRDRLGRPALVYASLGLLLLIGGISVAETLLAHR